MTKAHPLVLALGLAACTQADPKQAAQSNAEVGRWTIIHSPHIQRDTMLVDTVSGHTWQLVRNGSADDAPLVWERIYLSDDPNAPSPVDAPVKGNAPNRLPMSRAPVEQENNDGPVASDLNEE